MKSVFLLILIIISSTVSAQKAVLSNSQSHTKSDFTKIENIDSDKRTETNDSDIETQKKKNENSSVEGDKNIKRELKFAEKKEISSEREKSVSRGKPELKMYAPPRSKSAKKTDKGSGNKQD